MCFWKKYCIDNLNYSCHIYFCVHLRNVLLKTQIFDYDPTVCRTEKENDENLRVTKFPTRKVTGILESWNSPSEISAEVLYKITISNSRQNVFLIGTCMLLRPELFNASRIALECTIYQGITLIECIAKWCTSRPRFQKLSNKMTAHWSKKLDWWKHSHPRRC